MVLCFGDKDFGVSKPDRNQEHRIGETTRPCDQIQIFGDDQRLAANAVMLLPLTAAQCQGLL